MPDRFLGILGHEGLQLGLGVLVLEECGSCFAELSGELRRRGRRKLIVGRLKGSER